MEIPQIKCWNRLMSVFLDIFLLLPAMLLKKRKLSIKKTEGCEICREISHKHLPTNYINYQHVINTLNIKQTNIPERF